MSPARTSSPCSFGSPGRPGPVGVSTHRSKRARARIGPPAAPSMRPEVIRTRCGTSLTCASSSVRLDGSWTRLIDTAHAVARRARGIDHEPHGVAVEDGAAPVRRHVRASRGIVVWHPEIGQPWSWPAGAEYGLRRWRRARPRTTADISFVPRPRRPGSGCRRARVAYGPGVLGVLLEPQP